MSCNSQCMFNVRTYVMHGIMTMYGPLGLSHVRKFKANSICTMYTCARAIELVDCRRDLWHQKTRVSWLLWRCLCDPKFSHFGRTPPCDRQLGDRQTNEQMDGRTRQHI